MLEVWISELRDIATMLWLLLPGIVCGTLAGGTFAWFVWATTQPRHPQIPHQQQVCPRCGQHIH